ncbi:hypothetical protein H4R20_002653 [Coemansia guatemalensis]|uniref:RING-type E3 ubiquitin transferase n=1 Tax=Coemansia guatemalensis TaxID=2761395 RepID=A0A9W8HZK4_9FUNG|nr:hypothetical protein H4R20_002653 [Coemansia guatemalensis]
MDAARDTNNVDNEASGKAIVDKCNHSPVLSAHESGIATDAAAAKEPAFIHFNKKRSMEAEDTTVEEPRHETLTTAPSSTSQSEGEAAAEEETAINTNAPTDTAADNELRQRRRAGDTLADEQPDIPQETATTTAREEKGKEPAETGADGKERAAEVSGEFSCNICFDTATEPVLTICGHLFCWSCLVQWLERSATCPVCKAGCDKEKVIPVYGRGKEEKDPRLNPNMPMRPAGQRPPPPPPRAASQFFGFDPFGVPRSFHGVGMGTGRGTVFFGGVGFLPALMGFSTFSGAYPANPGSGVAQQAGQQAFFSRVLMMLAAMVLMSILFY